MTTPDPITPDSCGVQTLCWGSDHHCTRPKEHEGPHRCQFWRGGTSTRTLPNSERVQWCERGKP